MLFVSRTCFNEFLLLLLTPRFSQTRISLRKQLSLSDMGKDQPRSQGPPLYVEKVPWLRLVTCVLDFNKFQRCD